MSNLKKNKKGLEAGGFTIIIGIIILLISAGVIIWVIQQSAYKAGEKSQIEMCRASNEFKVSVAREKPAIVPFSSPSLCGTIDKTEDKLQVPTAGYIKKYDTPKEAAAAEIVDMIKNCWYMWLEGSDKEIFSNYFLWFGREDGCAVCYVFQINRNEVEDLTSNDLLISMERTYKAEDASDKCVPTGGGFFEDKDEDCGYDSRYNLGEPSRWKEFKPSKKADAANKKCCIREDILDECGNKGGKCLEDPDVGGFEHEYTWSCPESKKCFVTEGSHITYTEYIASGDRGGLLSLPEHPIHFSGDVFAISFYSLRSDPTWVEVSSLDYAISDQPAVGKCEILI